MFPNSTNRLVVGDACLIRRSDGRHVPFVYVGKRPGDRCYFFGALADVAVNAPDLGRLPAQVTLREHALVHIRCYKENNTPVVGNIRERLDRGQLQQIAADIDSSGVGHTTRVWGWKTIVERATSLAA